MTGNKYLSWKEQLLNFERYNCTTWSITKTSSSWDISTSIYSDCDYSVLLNTNSFLEVFFRMVWIVVIFLFVYKLFVWVRRLFE